MRSPPDLRQRFRDLLEDDRPVVLGAVGVFAIALVARLGYWAYAGTRVGKDTSGYLATCDLWLTDPLAAVQGFIGIEYAGFTLPACLAHALPGGRTLWIGYQIVIASLACVLVLDAARRAFGLTEGVVAGVTLAVLWDAFQWNVYVLSDTTFLVALTLAAWTLTRYLVSEDIGRLPVAAAFAMVAVSRPVGVPVLLGWLAWELLPSDRLHRRLTKHPIVAAGIGLLLVLVVGAVSGRSGWAENQMMDAWNAGLLVHDDPTFTLPIAWETADTPVQFILANPVAFPVMVLLKAGILFLPVVPRFSTIHNAVNVVTLAPAIVLGLTGLAYLTRHRRSLARAWGTPLIVLVGIVGVTFVDWDWRYRAPLAPLLAFGTAYAVGLVPTLRRGIRGILQRLARPFLRG